MLSEACFWFKCPSILNSKENLFRHETDGSIGIEIKHVIPASMRSEVCDITVVVTTDNLMCGGCSCNVDSIGEQRFFVCAYFTCCLLAEHASVWWFGTVYYDIVMHSLE